MPKGYWVSVYPPIENPERFDTYNELAGLAVRAASGRVLASIGSRIEAHEAGIAERVVLIEFDSFEQAVAARASAAYQKALAALPDGFERDFRIVEELERVNERALPVMPLRLGACSSRMYPGAVTRQQRFLHPRPGYGRGVVDVRR